MVSRPIDFVLHPKIPFSLRSKRSETGGSVSLLREKKFRYGMFCFSFASKRNLGTPYCYLQVKVFGVTSIGIKDPEVKTTMVRNQLDLFRDKECRGAGWILVGSGSR